MKKKNNKIAGSDKSKKRKQLKKKKSHISIPVKEKDIKEEEMLTNWQKIFSDKLSINLA